MKNVQKENLGQIGPISQNVNYKGQATDGSDLNELDLIARTILAVTHSEWKTTFDATTPHPHFSKGTPVAFDPERDAQRHEGWVVGQSLTGPKTFAVAVCGSVLYVAHNAALESIREVEPSEAEQTQIKAIVLDTLRVDGYHKVTDVVFFNLASKNNKTAFHAEMQLLSYFQANKLTIDGSVIGVSKPCCNFCANQLRAMGIVFSLEAVGDALGQWKIPDAHAFTSISANKIDPLG